MAKIDNKHKFIALNSDTQALSQSVVQHKIVLKSYEENGLGCGGDELCGIQFLSILSSINTTST